MKYLKLSGRQAGSRLFWKASPAIGGGHASLYNKDYFNFSDIIKMKTLNHEALKQVSGGRRQARLNPSGGMVTTLSGACEYSYNNIAKHEFFHVGNAANPAFNHKAVEGAATSHITSIWTSNATVAGALFSNILGQNNS